MLSNLRARRSGNCLVSELFQQLASSSETVILVRYVIDGDYMYILQDFGEDGVSCLSEEDFDALATDEEEANIGVNLSAWSVVKLE